MVGGNKKKCVKHQRLYQRMLDVPKNVGWGKPYTWPLLSRPFWLKRCVSFVCCLSLMDDVTLHTCDLFQNFWNLNHLKPTQPGILKSLLPTYKPSPTTVPDWNCSLPWHIYPIFSRKSQVDLIVFQESDTQRALDFAQPSPVWWYRNAPHRRWGLSGLALEKKMVT